MGEFASKGVAGAGLGTGIAGLGLGVLNAAGGLFGGWDWEVYGDKIFQKEHRYYCSIHRICFTCNINLR